MDNGLIRKGKGLMKANRFLSLLAIFYSVCCLLAVPQIVKADNITRSCKASYRVYLGVAKDSANAPFFKLAGLDASLLGLGTNRDTRTMISASGGCGRTVPNRCRQRASKALEQCARDHFANPGQFPASCGNVKHYDEFQNLEGLMENMVCKRVKEQYRNIAFQSTPKPFSIDVLPEVNILGDKGCDKKQQFQRIVVQCPD